MIKYLRFLSNENARLRELVALLNAENAALQREQQAALPNAKPERE
jgi:hypothetical protein